LPICQHLAPPPAGPWAARKRGCRSATRPASRIWSRGDQLCWGRHRSPGRPARPPLGAPAHRHDRAL